jgi:hypothetical protein
MRITATIVALFGVLNLRALPRVIPFTDNPRWPLMLLASILGILLIWVSVGIWTRRIFAWRLGFVAIALSAAYFIAQVCFTLTAVGTGEKAIIVSACSLVGLLVAGFWSVVWYRQKKWFANNQVA